MNIIQTNFQYRNPLIPLDLNKIIFIIVHHAQAVSAPPEQVHKWHQDNGWSGFGYNEMIDKKGNVYIGRGDNIGAQTANMNSKSYGICCEGDYSKETTMPEAQFNSLIERIKYNKPRFPNCIEVAPHSKFGFTECPGKYFPFDKLLNALTPPKFTLEDDIEMLSTRITITKEYWLKYARPGQTVRGDYAGGLIKNIATFIRKL